MPKLPNVTGKQLLKILQGIDYRPDYIKGSHHVLRDNNGKRIVVPVHGNNDLPKGTLWGILTDLGISREEFINLTKNKKR